MVVFFKVKLSKFYVVSSSKGRSRWDKKRSASSQKKYIQEVGSDNFALQRWRCIFYSHKHCTFFLQSILTDLVQFNRNDNNPQLLSILYAHRWTLRGINKYNFNYYVRINVIKTPETTVAMKSPFFSKSDKRFSFTGSIESVLSGGWNCKLLILFIVHDWYKICDNDI